MICNEARDFLSPYIDGMLSQEQERSLKDHLDICINCRRELGEMRNLTAVMNNMDFEPLPEGFQERLHEKLLAEAKHSKGVSPFSAFGKADRIEALEFIKTLGIAAAIVILLIWVQTNDSIDYKENKSPLTGFSKSEEKNAPKLDQQVEMDTAKDEPENKEKPEGKGKMADREENKNGDAKSFANDTSQKDSSSCDTSKEALYIKTNKVRIRVQDICVIPNTLETIAYKNEMDVEKVYEDGILIRVSGIEDRKVLYDELSKLGTIEDIGDNCNDNNIRIIIVRDE